VTGFLVRCFVLTGYMFGEPSSGTRGTAFFEVLKFCGGSGVVSVGVV
jgi:hypothetical protein